MQDKKVIDELRRIESERGLLIPSEVVEAARPATSPLHPHFEWDDSAAAEKYRIDQARNLIRVCVEYVGNGDSRRKIDAFVSLSTDRATGGGYRSMTHVLAMDNLRAQLIEDAILDMDRFRAKYASVAELVDVFASMNTARSELRPSGKGKNKAA